MYKTYKVAKIAEDLKDSYLKLVQEGYKPEEIEKFVKDIQDKDPSQVKSPTPSGGGNKMTKVPSSFGSVEEDEKYLATTFDPNMGSEKKNPEMSKDVEDLKKNDFQASSLKDFRIYADGLMMGVYKGVDEKDAVLNYVKDAGYESVEEAANVLGQSVEEFWKDLEVNEIGPKFASIKGKEEDLKKNDCKKGAAKEPNMKCEICNKWYHEDLSEGTPPSPNVCSEVCYDKWHDKQPSQMDKDLLQYLDGE